MFMPTLPFAAAEQLIQNSIVISCTKSIFYGEA